METIKQLLVHVPDAAWVAMLGFIGYELRQWRIWWQAQHGGAPDAAKKEATKDY